MSELAIHLENLKFGYSPDLLVLDIKQMQIERGQRVFLHGPSGSGKTTLLAILAGILAPREGQIRIMNQDIASMGSRERDHFRGVHMGYIFQMFNLIPYLDVCENICLPCRMISERQERVSGPLKEAAATLASDLGLGNVFTQPVTKLSVGQQQRVAAARALMGAPEVIIADEPTSALDYDHREIFIKLLFEQASKTNSTVLFVSHDRSLADLFDQKIGLAEINQAQGVNA
jgi:putative ABC transport system ATP-binding protein